jgi:uncharacterized lipoprotein YmbA
MKNYFSLTVLIFLAFSVSACGDKSEKYLLSDLSDLKKRKPAVSSVVVERLDLPDYVQDSEISIKGEDGVIRVSKDKFWADSPDRALSELLASGLDQSLSANVATAPWPFEHTPDIRIEVKVHRFIGTLAVNLTFSGQYFLTSPSGGTLERARRFSYTVPLEDDEIITLTQAYSLAIGFLRSDIANETIKVNSGQI